MTSILTHPDQATSEWLTDVLRGAGVLTHQRVIGVERERLAGRKADVAAPLRVMYSEGEGLPERLFLKLESRVGEVHFNHLIAPVMDFSISVRCYYAAQAQDRITLLFDDLSETHYTAPEVITPTRHELELMLDTLAKLHAFWWEHPRLKGDIGALSFNVDEFLLSRTRETFPNFLALMGDRLSAARRAIYERLLEKLPLPETRRAVTINQGDAHAQNFMLSKAGTAAVLIDCADWRIAPALNDVAFLLTLELYPEARARMENDLLRRDDCWLDYRRAVLRAALMPVFWSSWSPVELWWHPLEKVLAAYHDLACEELL